MDLKQKFGVALFILMIGSLSFTNRENIKLGISKYNRTLIY